MRTTTLVTVSDDRFGRKDNQYKATQDKIARLFQTKSSTFDCIGLDYLVQYTIDDVVNIVKNLYGDFSMDIITDIIFLLNNIDAAKNGRIYKPLVIWKALSKINDDDYLIYNDCSPELWNIDNEVFNSSKYSIEVIKHLCDINDGILTSFVKWDTRPIPKGSLGVHTHRNFTTKHCIERMSMERYENSFQHASGMIVLRKTPKSIRFVNDWIYWNSVDECCALGKSDILGDYSYWDEREQYYKIGHRHDQSISGLLINAMNNKLVDINYDTTFNNYNFLNFCRTDIEYKFIDSNLNPQPVDEIIKGDKVLNPQGVELRVFEIGANMKDGKYTEYLRVGVHPESTYNTTRDKLTKIIQ